MESAGSVIGTCLTMCPTAEIRRREQENLLHPFEALPMQKNYNREERKPKRRADPSRMVKEFSRPAAGRSDSEPSQLRPAKVLRDTVNYLYHSIVPKEHPAWSDVYHFVFDRLRAVRQDMVIQGLAGREAVSLLEQVVRFHLYASYRLRTADVAEFDPVINKQHLLECLKRLLYLYKVNPGYHPHREEFEGVYLLDNLGDRHALAHYLELPREIRFSPLVRQCYDISQAFVLRNYQRSLRLISSLTSPTCLCAVNPHLDNLAVNYLQILSSGYSVKNCKFPLQTLQQLLGLNSMSAVQDLCLQCGLLDRYDIPEMTGLAFVCFSKTRFHRPEQEMKNSSSLSPLDDLLSKMSLSPLLLGEPWVAPHSETSTSGTSGVDGHGEPGQNTDVADTSPGFHNLPQRGNHGSTVTSNVSLSHKSENGPDRGMWVQRGSGSSTSTQTNKSTTLRRGRGGGRNMLEDLSTLCIKEKQIVEVDQLGGGRVGTVDVQGSTVRDGSVGLSTYKTRSRGRGRGRRRE